MHCLCDLGHVLNLSKPQFPCLQNPLSHGHTVTMTRDEVTVGITGPKLPICSFKSKALKTEHVFLTDVVAT